jgi:N-formylglutamate amidohydrolase
MREYYEYYHEQLQQCISKVKKMSPNCLLLDVHGQSVAKDKILRGTRNGVTVEKMLQKFGHQSIQDSNSFLGMLNESGFDVFPRKVLHEEHKTFLGAYTVCHYGSHNRHAFAIDSIQLEIGLHYRQDEQTRNRLAKALKTAALSHYFEYICN